MPAMPSSWECTCSASGWAKMVRMAAATISALPLGTRASTLRMKWNRKDSTCRRVRVVGARCRQRGEELGCAGELGGSRGGDVAVLVQERTDLAQRAPDGAAADLEQLGEKVGGSEPAPVEQGGQHPLFVGDLLHEDAAAGAGQPFATALSMPVALGA